MFRLSFVILTLLATAFPAAVLHAGERSAGVSFALDVQPILTARGCNQGACHGKASGQNGFKLSLLGFDPDSDFAALVHESRGRRLFPAAPQRSLLLAKATAQLPHGGGRRIDPAGDDYVTLLRWIENGTPRRIDGEPHLERIAVSQTQRRMQPGQSDRLTVTAIYSDGSQREVTARSSFQTNESAIVAVDQAGEFTAGPIPGEATVMARYMDKIATCDVTIPLPDDLPAEFYAGLPRRNFIDDRVWQKLQQLNLAPSEVVPDGKFLRRVHLDIIGRLPTADEARAFLADRSPDKYQRLIDTLLERPEYADFWANRWADLLRPNPYRVGIKAVLNYDAWIRESFRTNKPYDQFVRELITAEGSTWQNGAVTLFRDRREPEEITTLVSQLFLGIRLECAKCHHHPFEKWGQDDFYSFAAFFSKLGRKGRGISPPISGSEEIVFEGKYREITHPLTGETLPPRPLFGEIPSLANGIDPRVALADWITSDENPFFAHVIVNRVWADIMGRGIVEPVDDLRVTNPPSNAPLLDELAEHFRAVRYDLKELIRTICSSHVYRLSSLPNDRNAADTRNYSRRYRQRLRAEVLLDAVADITGHPYDFQAMPAGSRATQLWTHRISSVFLDTFGRPNENQDPPCERTSDATVTQTLHLMNSPQIHQKILAGSGRVAELAAGDFTDDEIVETLYLTIYARLPDDQERAIAADWFGHEERSRRQATEDLMWALMNTAEFIFKD